MITTVSRWLVLVLLLAPELQATAGAQTFPDHMVKVIVPYTAGGGTDTVARAISQRLSEHWGQPVIVENRPGAGTSVSSQAAAKAPPDGYTLLFSDSGAFVINPHVYTKLRIDPVKDFAPVALVVRLAPVLAVANTTAANSVAEFIAYAKAHPGELTYASPGTGTYNGILRWNILSTWPASIFYMCPIKALPRR